MANAVLQLLDKHFGKDDMAEAIENAYQRGCEDTLADLTNAEALNALLEDKIIGDALCLIDMDALRGELLTGWICASNRLTRAMSQAAANADKERADKVEAARAKL